MKMDTTPEPFRVKPPGINGFAPHGLVSIGELLNEPKEHCSWLAENRLPMGGLSLLVAKPKVGKSTLARQLAISVAHGVPWLGHPVTQGSVIYIALEEKRSEVQEHFSALGARSDAPLYVWCEAAPPDATAWLMTLAQKYRPALIIIDPVALLIRVEDMDKYGSMTLALEPLRGVGRNTGACVFTTHHLRKARGADGDAILGSTAMFAAVDTALFLSQRGTTRTLKSRQRYGPDLEEVVLTLTEDRNVVTGGTLGQAAMESAQRRIMDYVHRVGSAASFNAVYDAIKGNRPLAFEAWKRLLASGELLKSEWGYAPPGKNPIENIVTDLMADDEGR